MQDLKPTHVYPHKVTISDSTVKCFSPTTKAVSATLSASKSAHWTGEPAMAIYRDVVRDTQNLALQSRSANCIPTGTALHVLSEIPRRLHFALSRLVADALPAILHSADDEKEAEDLLQCALHSYNDGLFPSLAALHQVLQNENEQMDEVARWPGCKGIVIDALVIVSIQFAAIAAISRNLAPTSNPQSRMVAEDAELHLTGLFRTLNRCA